MCVWYAVLALFLGLVAGWGIMMYALMHPRLREKKTQVATTKWDQYIKS